MGTYYIPRNVKGEGRILYVFSTKALIYTAAFAGVGLLFYFLFNLLGLKIVGIIITAIFGLIGFSIATFKIPESPNWEITKKNGGQNIDDVIIRAIKFKMRKNKIYVYEREEKKNEQ